MNGVLWLVVVFVVFGIILATIAFLAYRRVLRRAKGVERGLKMVPLLIHLPPPSDDTENSGNRDERDIMREKIAQAQVLYDLISGTAQNGFKSNFYGQRHIAFEIVASNGLVHYFAAVPVALVSVVEQAIVTAYPGARLEEVEDHNIFNPQGHLTGTVGGELVLKHQAAYPIGTVDQMERDPMVGLLNALSKLQLGDGAAVQIMLRPAKQRWTKNAIKLVDNTRHTRRGGLGFGIADIAKGAVKTSEEWREDAKSFELSKLEEDTMQRIEEKTKHPGYEVLIRVLTSSPTYDRSQMLLRNLITSFALFEAPGSNGFQFVEGRDMQGLVTAFIFRFFPPELTANVLNSVELATLFHLPDAQFTPTTQVERQKSKQVDGPTSMSQNGLLMGYNFFRGVKKEVRMSPEDRRRHTYIVGQTGTGKSTILENLAVQDMLAGNGFAFIDPHGDTAEKLISMVPKERAEDVIYFNPGDMEHPLGLNLFEYSSPQQKDFLVQESINMLYKLYDPGKTGIIGPRFEHWFRSAALTLMSDPNGASFIEIPKVFTDTAYLKNKFKYLNDPTVIEFWTKEMAQTSDYHKSEMLGWFVSKFGAFLSNEMMRNIIGQTHSGFNIRDIMDNKKILIVNLGKGLVGELNSQLLGMIFVIKFQAAAMSRSSIPEDQRQDFCLYVDEFQNFSTDSFASILSEARKYRLNLIVANQFIGQLSDEIRDAVFGNVGTMLSFRTGPEDAEFLVKQFEPIFDQRDMVNLPNYNAVMKLLIGGLPSLPFSITMLPPLGQSHPEMGLAIKQLSAAKFGVPRATAEADIFARLQNTPPPVAAPAPASAPTPEPTPSAAAQTPISEATPKPDAASASMLPPAQAKPASTVAAAPVIEPQPSVAPADGLSLSQLKSTSPQPPSQPSAPVAATAPPTASPSPTPAPTATPPTPESPASQPLSTPSPQPADPPAQPATTKAPPPPAPVPNPAPVSTPELASNPGSVSLASPSPPASVTQQSPAIPTPKPDSPVTASTPAPNAPSQVESKPQRPTPPPELPVPVAAEPQKSFDSSQPTPPSAPKTAEKPLLRIEAHETDGRVDNQPSKPLAPATVSSAPATPATELSKSPSSSSSQPSTPSAKTQPAEKPLLRIEAHETDGRVDAKQPAASVPASQTSSPATQAPQSATSNQTATPSPVQAAASPKPTESPVSPAPAPVPSSAPVSAPKSSPSTSPVSQVPEPNKATSTPKTDPVRVPEPVREAQAPSNPAPIQPADSKPAPSKPTTQPTPSAAEPAAASEPAAPPPEPKPAPVVEINPPSQPTSKPASKPEPPAVDAIAPPKPPEAEKVPSAPSPVPLEEKTKPATTDTQTSVLSGPSNNDQTKPTIPVPSPSSTTPPQPPAQPKTMIATHKARVLNPPHEPHSIDPATIDEVESTPSLQPEHLPNDLPKGIVFKNPTISKHSAEPAKEPSITGVPPAYASAAVPKIETDSENASLQQGHHQVVIQPPTHQDKTILEELAEDEAAAKKIIDAAANSRLAIPVAAAVPPSAATVSQAPSPAPITPMTVLPNPIKADPVPVTPPPVMPAPEPKTTPAPAPVVPVVPPTPAQPEIPEPVKPDPVPSITLPAAKPSEPEPDKDTKSTATEASAATEPSKDEKPKLKPGEVYIDDEGNIIQG